MSQKKGEPRTLKLAQFGAIQISFSHFFLEIIGSNFRNLTKHEFIIWGGPSKGTLWILLKCLANLTIYRRHFATVKTEVF